MDSPVALNRIPPLRLAWKRLAGAGMLLLLSACAVGPDYQRPATEMGDTYKQALAGEVDQAANQGWTRVQPGEAAMLRSDWWLLYDDPVLSGLMDSLQQ